MNGVKKCDSKREDKEKIDIMLFGLRDEEEKEYIDKKREEKRKKKGKGRERERKKVEEKEKLIHIFH